MKTTIIHLEPHDDLISIRDRMSWAKTPRILLVWPRRGRVDDVRPLDLALLQRRARGLGAQLGLVTRNAEIWQAAHEQHIPCFSTAKHAQRKPWQTMLLPELPAPRKRDLRGLRAQLPGEPYQLGLAGRIAIFGIGVFAVLFIVLLFLPSAQINITPPIRQQTVTIPVSASAATSQVYLSGQIPLRRFTLDLQASASLPASGQTDLPGQPAQAVVSFSNASEVDVNLPAGTILLTRAALPQAFETTTGVLVPARNREPVEARVRALSGGAAGNVPANAISAFQSALGLNLTVYNEQAATGGSDRRGPSPSEQDREQLNANLLKKLAEQARVQLPAELKPGDLLLPDSVKLVEVLERQFSPTAGAPAETLTLSLRVRFEAAYAAESDLRQLAALTLDAALPAGFSPRPATLTVNAVTRPELGLDGLARWQLQVSRSIQMQIDPTQVLFLTQGRRPRQAIKALNQAFELSIVPVITVRPVWWPWLPLLPFRILVSAGL